MEDTLALDDFNLDSPFMDEDFIPNNNAIPSSSVLLSPSYSTVSPSSFSFAQNPSISIYTNNEINPMALNSGSFSSTSFESEKKCMENLSIHESTSTATITTTTPTPPTTCTTNIPSDDHIIETSMTKLPKILIEQWDHESGRFEYQIGFGFNQRHLTDSNNFSSLQFRSSTPIPRTSLPPMAC